MNENPTRAAIYARVSTLNGQTAENQLLELREVTERRDGWQSKNSSTKASQDPGGVTGDQPSMGCARRLPADKSIS